MTSLISFRDLIVWQKSYLLVKDIYKITDKLPKNESYGLASQVQRSAISIPSNIAEGQQRNNIKEYLQFIGIAKNSAAELETQLLLIGDVYNLDVSAALKELDEVQKMLMSLSKKLKPKTYHL